MTTPLITCGHCNGTGRVPLSPEHQRTLDLVRSGLSTAPEIYRAQPGCVSPAAANNRLEKLRRLGLVTRERLNGKTWAYRAERSDP